MMLHLALAAIPLQTAFLAAHFLLAAVYPQNIFLREALPLVYLATTYAQWLIVAAILAFRFKKPVPLVMHLPHLLSFLPLLRHVMLAASRTPTDAQSLTLAWVHTALTHMFSLIAAWRWQLQDHKWDLPRAEKIRLALYSAAAVTTIMIYAGLDFAFADSFNPIAISIVQFLLAISVSAILLLQAPTPMAVSAAVIFSLANAALLFDQARATVSIEAALAATSLTQYFALYVLAKRLH